MLIAFLVIFQLIVFVGLVVMLRRILARNIVSATRHLDEMNQDYMKKEEELNKKLEEAKQISGEMIRKAKEEAETIRKDTMQATKTESDNLITQARSKSEEIMKQAEKSRQTLLEEMEERIRSGAIDKAADLMHDTLPQKFMKDIHSQWIENLIGEGFGQLKNVRLEEGVKDIRVVSAFALEGEQRQALSKKLKSVLNIDLPIKEEVDPRIVAGVVIHVGSLVLDGSLKSKIQEKARDAKHSSDR